MMVGHTEGWTSVDKGLPQPLIRVLIYSPMLSVEIGSIDVLGGWWDDDGERANPTYWMPLPNPPEARE